jgi:hypothetical protein
MKDEDYAYEQARQKLIKDLGIRLEQKTIELADKDAEITALHLEIDDCHKRIIANGKQIVMLRETVAWYADEARAISQNMLAKQDIAVLASVQVLSLDAGSRAEKALAATQDLSGLVLCDAEPVGVVDEDDDARWGDIYTDADVRVGTKLYKARKQP